MQIQKLNCFIYLGRELCYVLLFGILISYAVPFILLLEPSQFSCTVLRYRTHYSLYLYTSSIYFSKNPLRSPVQLSGTVHISVYTFIHLLHTALRTFHFIQFLGPSQFSCTVFRYSTHCSLYLHTSPTYFSKNPHSSHLQFSGVVQYSP